MLYRTGLLLIGYCLLFCGSLGETRICVETLALRARFPTQFLVSPKRPRVFL